MQLRQLASGRVGAARRAGVRAGASPTPGHGLRLGGADPSLFRASSPSGLDRLHAAPARGARLASTPKKKELQMWESLREAVDEEMERDPMVCIMGALGRAQHR
jgi:hypothetical protein